MKKLIECADKEGLEKLMGERITLFCLNYIYTGKLVGINEDCVLLKDPAIVYETGGFDTKDWKDAQKLPKDEWYVMLQAVESFGVMKIRGKKQKWSRSGSESGSWSRSRSGSRSWPGSWSGSWS